MLLSWRLGIVVFFLSQLGAAERSFFEPIAPRGNYRALVWSKLVDTERTSFAMVVTPSFSREYAVYLVPNESLADGRKPQSYSLVYAERSGEISLAKAAGSGGEVSVARQAATLDGDLAREILKAASGALVFTRYELPGDISHIRCDGVTYEFGCGGYWGSAWSPKRGLPGQLAKLGELLAEYARADDEARRKTVGSIRALCRLLRQDSDALAKQERYLP